MTARAGMFQRDIQLLIDQNLSPEAVSRLFGQTARKIIEDQDTVNDRAAKRDVKYKTFVDGKASASLETAKRVIVAEWQMIEAALRDIHVLLTDKSPVLKGVYKRSITLFADGVATPVDGDIAEADEYFFAATVPYARKIERGLSSLAPNGVFEAVAAVAAKRFGDMASIRFSFRTLSGISGRSATTRRQAAAIARDERQPAIVIRPR